MGKTDLTAKAIGKRIKAAGLQRLRWYCQMCTKQCRDENGFRNHCASEGHRRMMALFGEKAQKFLSDFSKQFLNGFMEIVKLRYRTVMVSANEVYNQYIADRHHVHMNATRWETLTAFVMYLGKEGICKVEEGDRGWRIQYIDRDPAVLAKQAALKRKEKLERTDEERQIKLAEKMNAEKGLIESTATGLQREAGAAPLKFAIKKRKLAPAATPAAAEDGGRAGDDGAPASVFDRAAAAAELAAAPAQAAPPPPRSALEKIRLEEEASKEKRNRREDWLAVGIVVRVSNKKLADGKYHKKRAVVLQVVDTFLAKVRVLDLGDVLEIDQAHLMTLVPARNAPVLLVNGAYRGERGIVVSHDKEEFITQVRITTGIHQDRTVAVDDDDVCELSEA